jgi:hypothetical protein
MQAVNVGGAHGDLKKFGSPFFEGDDKPGGQTA